MKFKTVFILIFAVLRAVKSSATARNETDPNVRVFGGYIIPQNNPNRQGFTVRLEYTNSGQKVVCSGSIITQMWILSLASCLQSYATTPINVRITGLLGEAFESTITVGVLHPSYDSTTGANNIALGKVEHPFSSNGNFFPVALGESNWDGAFFLGRSLTVCGYRNPYTTLNRPTDEPTCSVFIPRNNAQCTAAGLTLRTNEICAFSLDLTTYSVCEQDFGAGLINYNPSSTPDNFFIYAMATHGLASPNDCATGPSVFLLLRDFHAWIHENAG